MVSISRIVAQENYPSIIGKVKTPNIPGTPDYKVAQQNKLHQQTEQLKQDVFNKVKDNVIEKCKKISPETKNTIEKLQAMNEKINKKTKPLQKFLDYLFPQGTMPETRPKYKIPQGGNI